MGCKLFIRQMKTLRKSKFLNIVTNNDGIQAFFCMGISTIKNMPDENSQNINKFQSPLLLICFCNVNDG